MGLKVDAGYDKKRKYDDGGSFRTFGRNNRGDRRDRNTRVSVGSSTRSTNIGRPTMPSIPFVVPLPPFRPSTIVPGTIARANPSQNTLVISERPEVMPQQLPVGWGGPAKVKAVPDPRPSSGGLPDWYLKNFQKGLADKYQTKKPIAPIVAPGVPQNIKRVVIPQPVPPVPQPQPIVSKKAPDMSLDLGSIITGLGGAYINAKYPTSVPYQQPVSGYSDYIPDTLEPLIYGNQGACCEQVVPPAPKGYHYSRKGCLTANRRRRKRLATASDIKDLSALKTVLSGPQVATWIATH